MFLNISCCCSRLALPCMLHSWLMLYLSAVTQEELWVNTDLSVMEIQTGSMSEGRFIENSRAWSIPQLCRPVTRCWPDGTRPWFGRAAAMCVLSSAVSRFWGCGGAYIIELLFLLVHCPPETLWDKAINTQPQHLTTSLYSCCWESTGM